MLPTEKTVGAALEYLAETDEAFAISRAGVEMEKHRLKVARAVAMLESGEKSAAAQETHALVSENYRYALERLENVTVDYEIMAAKRKRAELTIEVWRSVNANRRQGQ